MSGPVMVACFWVSCYAVIHPAKQPSNKRLKCHAAKLSSSQAATVAHPSCQTAKLTLLQVARPACQAAKLYTCCLHTLSSFSCHAAYKLQHTQTCGSTSGPIQTRIQTDPDPIQTTASASIQTTFSPVLKRVIVWVLSFLQLLVRNPLTLELMSKVARVLTVKLNPKCEHCTWSSWNRSLHLSMWPLVKPQTHVDIWCHIMKTWSSSCCLGNLWIMSLYVTPSFQTSGSPRDDPEGF